MIYAIAALSVVCAWYVWQIRTMAKTEAVRTAAVLSALRVIQKPMSDDFQYTIGTIREDGARSALVAIYDAIETIENTQP